MCKRIGIIGSRSRDTDRDFDLCHDQFLKIYEKGDWIVSGGANKGGDRFARILSKMYAVPYLEFPANWEKYGKSAGFKRNEDIARLSHCLIAVLDPENGRGTQDTIDKFIAGGGGSDVVWRV